MDEDLVCGVDVLAYVMKQGRVTFLTSSAGQEARWYRVCKVKNVDPPLIYYGCVPVNPLLDVKEG